MRDYISKENFKRWEMDIGIGNQDLCPCCQEEKADSKVYGQRQGNRDVFCCGLCYDPAPWSCRYARHLLQN